MRNIRKRKVETLTPIIARLLSFLSLPFRNSGSVYFGFFYVPVKRSTDKRWRSLIRCFTTRTILFEVGPSMDASSSIFEKSRTFFPSRHHFRYQTMGPFLLEQKKTSECFGKRNQKSIAESMVKKCVIRSFIPICPTPWWRL